MGEEKGLNEVSQALGILGEGWVVGLPVIQVGR